MCVKTLQVSPKLKTETEKLDGKLNICRPGCRVHPTRRTRRLQSAGRKGDRTCLDWTPRAREGVVPISELVFGTSTQNRSSLERSLAIAAIAARRAW
jgi:hypothetical protein